MSSSIPGRRRHDRPRVRQGAKGGCQLPHYFRQCGKARGRTAVRRLRTEPQRLLPGRLRGRADLRLVRVRRPCARRHRAGQHRAHHRGPGRLPRPAGLRGPGRPGRGQGRRRHRGYPLHLWYDRPSEGRRAHPRQPHQQHRSHADRHHWRDPGRCDLRRTPAVPRVRADRRAQRRGRSGGVPDLAAAVRRRARPADHRRPPGHRLRGRADHVRGAAASARSCRLRHLGGQLAGPGPGS
jgi:hypothetical protein